MRALIELSVLAIGSALGGTADAVACALSIGPLTHMLPRLTANRATRQERSTQP